MAEGGKKKNKRCETSTVDAPKTKKLKKTKPKDGTMKKTAAQMEYEANLDAYLERFTEFFKVRSPTIENDVARLAPAGHT